MKKISLLFGLLLLITAVIDKRFETPLTNESIASLKGQFNNVDARSTQLVKNDQKQFENLFGKDPKETQKLFNAELTEMRGSPTNTIYTLSTPIDWSSTGSRVIDFRIHSWGTVDSLLLVYDNTGDEAYLQKAFDIALDWSQQHPQHQPNTAEYFAWYDMAVGVRTHQLAFLFETSLIDQELISDEEQEVLWNSLIEHLLYLQDDDNIIFHNNHGIYQSAGQIAATKRLSALSKIMPQINEFAHDRLDSIVAGHFSDEAIHLEHSPSYHIAVYDILLTLQQNGIFESEGLQDMLGDIEDNIYWLVRPDGEILNFGDSDQEDTVFVENDSFSSPYNALACLKDLSDQCNNNQFVSFPGSGYAIYKEGINPGDDYFAFTGSFHSRTHKHADDQSFVWTSEIGDILIDAGKYDYSGKTKAGDPDHSAGFWYSDPKRQYVERTRAHNALEIDNQDYVRKGRDPFGSSILKSGELNDDIYYIHSLVSHTDTLDHGRTLLYSPEKWLVVLDFVQERDGNLTKPHNYKQWFQLGAELNIEQTDDSTFTAISSVDPAQRVTISNIDGISSSSQVYNASEEPLQGWSSKDSGEFTPSSSLYWSQDEDQTSGENVISTFFAIGEDVPTVNMDRQSELITLSIDDTSVVIDDIFTNDVNTSLN